VERGATRGARTVGPPTSRPNDERAPPTPMIERHQCAWNREPPLQSS
jgi:hypothetical protein